MRWVIDPLDGTTNYVYGYPAFAVSIAVEIDGRPQIGVVHDSSSGHVYRAISGFGAVCDERPLRVREQPDLAKALVATGFSYEAAQRERQGLVVAQLLSRVRDLRRGGSAALDLCHVAAGHVDAYWETGLAPWDYAAGLVIAREAGAEVLVLDVAPRRGPRWSPRPPSSCRTSLTCCARPERSSSSDAAEPRAAGAPCNRAAPRPRRGASRSRGS